MFEDTSSQEVLLELKDLLVVESLVGQAFDVTTNVEQTSQEITKNTSRIDQHFGRFWLCQRGIVKPLEPWGEIGTNIGCILPEFVVQDAQSLRCVEVGK